MKKLRKISKDYYLKQTVCCWLVFYMLFCFGIPAQIAMADTSPGVNAIPGAGDLTSAVGAGITLEAANLLEVTQTSQEAIMNWTNFDIGADAEVEFFQPDATAAVLNRVSDASGTGIMGTLTANGRVFIVNPAGIVFGSGASVNVAQLVASSLNLTDDDFLNGSPYTFTGGATAGDVINNTDNINAERVALIGRNVYNNGAINAGESVVIAAGDTVRIIDGTPIVVEVDMADFQHVIQNDNELSAKHIVLAAGDVWSTSYIYASDYYGESETHTDAFASVTIDAARDVEINASNLEDEEYSIEVDAGYDQGEGQALAKIDITAGRNVLIDGTGSDEGAGLYAYGSAYDATGDGQGGKSNPTGEINITAGGDLDILNSYVSTEGYSSTSDLLGNPGDDRLGEGTGIINITTDGSVILQNGVIYATGQSWDSTDNDIVNDHPGNGYATLTIDAGGSVTVQSDSAIEAYSYVEEGNATAIVDIDSVAGVYVDSDSEIIAYSEGSMYEVVADQVHTSVVDIQTGGDIIVNGLVEAHAEVYDDWPDDNIGPMPTATYAKVVLKAMGNIVVNETPGASDALVFAEAKDSDDNYAEVTMLAVENVIVNDGATAVSAEIVAWAEEDDSVANEALIGIATQNGDIIINGQMESASRSDTAHDFTNIKIFANDAVVIDGKISTSAFSLSGDAQVSIAAGGEISGSGVIDAQGATTGNITVYATSEDNITFKGEIVAYGGELKVEPDIVIGPIEPSENGPDWSWTEQPPEEPIPPQPDPEPTTEPESAPAAPLVQLLDETPTIEGCPAEMQAAAAELGITQATIQMSIGNALALNPTLQACDACATLIDAALVLRDEDGSRMAAMTQMFNSMAPAGAPYTPEMQALIATAFAGAAEGSQYATVMEYTDAFVRYYSVLETDLASPVGDSLAFVMGKYGAGVLGSDNNNIAAFVATRLETGETFGD